ncbi:hypothetical protein GGTG_06933 [Gaeumannomyces tritici R3-111a-1]|uniref:Uncharacterized protein n=1 Tax=Gaeumannomyces tritici (strain R3-111a-1) TaxID=644352 RepID=J3P086_GAET3|nr:hypothetical protein GGTG_06933 [Gaeumannomyces tritici R3-111a-1]EJT77019.1 hypothetical protein GGTG_06933 [Gaeumannomyces tritici R3-111a-1]
MSLTNSHALHNTHLCDWLVDISTPSSREQLCHHNLSQLYRRLAAEAGGGQAEQGLEISSPYRA